MKKIILIHACMLATSIFLFFTCGVIDKGRLEKASLSHHPNLLFSHEKCVVRDGGSIYWRSLIYNGYEKRSMKLWEEDEELLGERDFQGIDWTWKYHNLVWLALMVGSSFVGSVVTCLRCKPIKEANVS